MASLGRIRKKPDGPYSLAKCGLSSPPALLHGIDEFNRGLYFEQHETLEKLWQSESDDARYLYQGILLVGVGVYHLRRGNHAGGRSKLSRAIELLRWFRPVCQGVDVGRLIDDSERLLAAVETLGPARSLEIAASLLPRVWLVPASAASRESRGC